MRRHYRAIAKARMRCAGTDRVNRKLGMRVGGIQNWRRVIFGDLSKESEAYQTRNATKNPGKKRARRIKRLTAA